MNLKKLIVLLAALMTMGMASATVCDIPGSGCNEQGWAAPNCAGGYGGFDGVGCSGVAMVVAPGTCDGSDDSASVDIDAATLEIMVTSDPAGWDYCDGYGHLAINWIEKDGNTIRVRYLDGFDDDAFDIYYDDMFVCSVTMQADGQETWETAECRMQIPAPEFASIGIALAVLLTTPAFAYLLVKKRQ